ncbi:MAG: tyrosine-type recombinase/integrase [Cellvibrionales bacterium]|nr:tyrosine-type recombinase/integrase [Cellvibrionales bacterium]
MNNKTRTHQGVALHKNLYPNQYGIEDKWRVKLPDGSFKSFTAKDANEANKLAQWAIENADTFKQQKPNIDDDCLLMPAVLRFIKDKEDEDPKLKNKYSWTNQRIPALKSFARYHADVPLYKLNFKDHMRPWWKQLTHHAQHSRKALFREFFNDLLADDLLPAMPYNPFLKESSKPFLKYKIKPEKKRARLPLEVFQKIYEQAGKQKAEFLQIAMMISLLTTMRRGDLVALRFDKHIENNQLKKSISKSEKQKGEFHGSNLVWDLSHHTLLKATINKARELSLKNRRCPYIISKRAERDIKSPQKSHPHQVLPNYLTTRFGLIRDQLVGAGAIDEIYATTSFHEIRSLGSHLLKTSGNDIEDIQELMAHSDKSMTQHYLKGHEKEWTPIEINIDETVLNFKI